MLEIVNNNNKESGGCDFPRKMVDLQIKTIEKIANLCFDYGIDPFGAIKIFGAQLIQAGADMQAQREINKDDKEGGKE